MLDKQSKKVLNVLISLADERNLVVSLEKLYDRVPKKHAIDSIYYLSRKEYLVVFPGEDEPGGVQVLYEGLHHSNFNWLELKSFIIRSVTTPIFISAVTALITLHIKGLF